ncbi:endo alpha-1,4 polygalactosaminidase [Streptomyces sp. CC210A]|uniref:endo alpha-1,4 polygalactosaminidase n=1 Tax=Streptomyces sp. CC210A TaxID=2898184 RepID=UPI001F2078B3|nr:endo alpha-1,4 polygalactosaminidase [Streptomyces sp. CC210A]
MRRRPHAAAAAPTLLLLLAVLAACTGTGPPGSSASGPARSPHGTAAPGTAEPPARTTPPEEPDPADGAGTPRPTGGTGSAARWRPRPGLTWQWQLDGRVDTSVDADVYDIDAFENDAADVARLHRAGRKVICYVNAGAWEDYRPDRDAFPRSVLGAPNGWHGERWLDIRRLEVLRPLMERRFDMCRDKGFDAVEPDLLEGYAADTGFPLTAQDQLAYNRMIAEIAHERGLAVGLKNDLAQIPQLIDHFDFAVNEECAQYDECALLEPFVAAGKAVFHVEYEQPVRAFCPQAEAMRFSSMLKRPQLDAWRAPC